MSYPQEYRGNIEFCEYLEFYNEKKSIKAIPFMLKIGNYKSNLKIAPFSVLISIYRNTNAVFFEQALHSVWTNQILKPSEIVVVCDGPIPTTVENVLLQWKTKLIEKIVVVKLSVNSGLSVALNKGLEHCSYDLVARMDDDDVSLPSRFLYQYTFMELHQDIAVLGAQVEERSEDLKKVLSSKKLPLTNEQIIKFSKWRCPVNHPTVFFRKHMVQKVGGYPNIYPEDYPLWGKMIVQKYRIQNLPDKLVIMRQELAAIHRRGIKFFFGEVKVLKFLYSIGHISFNQFVFAIATRFFLRLAPGIVKIAMYRVFR